MCTWKNELKGILLKKFDVMNKNVIELNGSVDSWGYQSYLIKSELKKNEGKAVTLRINSYGGDVNQAMVIAKAIEEHGNVTVEFLGMNASAVTWMAFSAKTIKMYEDALWLCHKSAITVDIWSTMKSEDIEKTIKELQSKKATTDAVDAIIATKYLNRCSKKCKNIEDVIGLMNEERFMPASEALEWGFVDEIIKGASMSDEQKEIAKNICNSMQFPEPVFVTVENKPDKSIIGRIKDVFSAGTDTGNNESDEGNNTDNNNKIPKTMKKVVMNVAALLAVLAINEIEEENGTVQLSVEQLGKINDALAAADNDKTKATEAQNALKDVESVLDSMKEGIKEIEGAKNKANAVKLYINSLPAVAPAGTVIPKEENNKSEEDLSEFTKDEINQIVK